MLQSAEVLVLKKIPFRESSLVVSGISPDDGRIDFVMKGAQTVGAKKFPVIDIFRQVRIDFHPVSDGMPSVYSAESITAFDAIGSHAGNYMLACELGKFALDNSSPQLPCPELCGAMVFVLGALGGSGDAIPTAGQCRLLVRLAYLNENGLLPEALNADAGKNEMQQRLMAVLLEAAQGDMPLPPLTEDYWQQLEEWSGQLCRFHGLKMP
ncbi:MAG: recombination protein O N-terminal domain-containing protein [Victivallales bacterium]|nr:recombination protein O N-terminal domain-containing protein [Victivallales bacterium]